MKVFTLLKSVAVACAFFASTSLKPATINADFTLLSNYEFNDSFADSLGNSADLVSLGAGSIAGGSFFFDFEDGLSLDTNLTSSDYGIELDVRFTNLDGWDKLIDFQNLTSDTGFYVDPSEDQRLSFYNYPFSSPSSLSLDTSYTIGLARVGDQLTVSLDGVEQFTLTDNAAFGVSAFDKLYFFVDDSAVPGEEAAGSVSAIRLYSSTSVPEPTSIALLTCASFLMGGFARKRLSRRH